MTPIILRALFLAAGLLFSAFGFRLLSNDAYYDTFDRKWSTPRFDKLMFSKSGGYFYNRYVRGAAAGAIGLWLIYLAVS